MTNPSFSPASTVSESPWSKGFKTDESKNSFSKSRVIAKELKRSSSDKDSKKYLEDLLYRNDQEDNVSEHPSHREVELQVALVEARLDTKLTGIEGKLDIVSRDIQNMSAQFDIRLDSFDVKLNSMDEQIKDAKTAAEDAKKSSSNVKWHILFTGLGVAAVLFAVWTVWIQGMELVSQLLGNVPEK